MNAAPPILIAYDGSDSARRAVHEAAELFGSRRALVVTAWDPNLPYEAAAITATPGLDTVSSPADVETAKEVDNELQAGARHIAEDGTALATSLGLQAEALVVTEENSDVADAIIEVARKRDVAAIVIGSRRLSGLRARLAGGTSSAVLQHSSCPVVTVHAD